MVRLRTIAVSFLGFLTAGGSAADGVEISQSDVRAIVAAGQSVPVDRLLERIKADLGGDPVDVRAFDVGEVYYRVLVMLPNGRMVSIVVEARSGAYVSPRSSVALEVRELAATAPGQDRAPGLNGSAPGQSGNANAHGGNGGGNGGGGNGNGSNGGGNDNGNNGGGNDNGNNGGGNDNGNNGGGNDKK